MLGEEEKGEKANAFLEAKKEKKRKDTPLKKKKKKTDQKKKMKSREIKTKIPQAHQSSKKSRRAARK